MGAARRAQQAVPLKRQSVDGGISTVGVAMKTFDISKKRVPKTIVWVQNDEDISFYQVWVYPYAKMPKGARVSFFRANREKKVVCHIYLEEDFKPETTSGELGATQVRRFYDGLCAIAQKALAKKGVHIEEDYDTHIDAGLLTYDDFA